MGQKKKYKKPAHIKSPKINKVPRRIEKVSPKEEEYISWHLRILDKDGNWGWKGIDENTIWKDIHSKLSEFERKTWNEILIKERHKNHTISISDICSEAQKRLKEIKQDDIDQLISLRLTGKKRIWGIKKENILKILWWDPDHNVYLSKKKHT